MVGGSKTGVWGPSPPRRTISPWAVLLSGAAAASLAFGAEVPAAHRGILAAALVAALALVAWRQPGTAATLTLLFLPFLALIRRLLISDSGWSSFDPLLLVGPLMAVVLVHRLVLAERRPIAPDRTSMLVLALIALSVAEVLNPDGGGASIGAVGLLFLAAPLLWFFVGREVGSEGRLQGLLTAVVVVAAPIGLYGLLQGQLGMPSWDRAWLALNTGYQALNVGTAAIRPFATFSSFSEYSRWLAVAMVIAVAFAMHRRPRLLWAMPLVVPALVLSAVRESAVLGILGLIAMAGLRTRRAGRATVIVLVSVAVLLAGGKVFGGALTGAASQSGNALLAHQVAGLVDPTSTDQSTSTLGIHWKLALSGIEQGFTHPLGQGPGAVNIASQQLTGAAQPTDITEIDVSDAFVALGLLGGGLFLALLWTAFRRVAANYVARPTAAGLAAFGILVAELGQWLSGGDYALTPLLWFVLGWATRPQRPAPVRPRASPVFRLPRRPPRPRSAPPRGPWQPGGSVAALARPGTRSLRREGVQMVSFNGLGLLASVVSGVVLARVLGAEGRGAVSAVLVGPALTTVVFAMGCSPAAAYHFARHPRDGARLFSTWLALLAPLTLIGAVALYAVLPVLLGAQSASTVSIARWAVLAVPIGPLSELVDGMLLGDHDFRAYNLLNFAQLALLAGGYALLASIGSLSVVGALIVNAISGGLCLIVGGARVLRRVGFARPNLELARSTFWYGLRAHGTNTGAVANERLDLLLVPAFVGAASVGLYSVASSISWIVISLAGACYALVLPVAVRQGADGHRAVLASLWATLLLATLLALGLLVGAGTAIRVVYGAGFAGALTPLLVLLPGSVLYAGTRVLWSGLYALERPGVAALAQIPGVLITLVGLAVLLPRIGIDGAALVSSVAYTVLFAVSLLLYRRTAHLRWAQIADPTALRATVRGLRTLRST
jgi:O-antigen/teichoic acid export membrane protein